MARLGQRDGQLASGAADLALVVEKWAAILGEEDDVQVDVIAA
jgi:hypothetical protein